MKKILKVTVFFAILGLLAFSFVTCKHSSGSSDDDPYGDGAGFEEGQGGNGPVTDGNQGTSGDNSGDGSETSDPNNPGGGSGDGGDDQEGGGDGSGEVKPRQPLGYQDVVDLLSSGSEFNPVKYKQIWDGGSDWGEFSLYKEGSNYYYEFDNKSGNDDQEQGDVVINEGDASVTLTAKYWHNTDAEYKEDKNEWVEEAPDTSSPKHQSHEYCGFILQFYDDDTAEAYEWLVKEGHDNDIPHTFPTNERGTDTLEYIQEGEDKEGYWDYTADVVYECITKDGDYYWKQ